MSYLAAVLIIAAVVLAWLFMPTWPPRSRCCRRKTRCVPPEEELAMAKEHGFDPITYIAATLGRGPLYECSRCKKLYTYHL